MPRPECDRCLRPQRICLCAALPAAKLRTRTRVVVLQHYREARDKTVIGTVPLLKLCLENVEVVVDDFDRARGHVRAKRRAAAAIARDDAAPDDALHCDNDDDDDATTAGPPPPPGGAPAAGGRPRHRRTPKEVTPVCDTAAAFPALARALARPGTLVLYPGEVSNGMAHQGWLP